MQLGQAEGSVIDAIHVEIDDAVQGVAIGFEHGRQPHAGPDGVEEFDDRHWVAARVSRIGDQLRAQLGGQEDHAALRSISASTGAEAWTASRCARMKSAAFEAALAARTMARSSSRMTASHAPI